MCLLELQTTIKALVYADEASPPEKQLIVTGDAKAKNCSRNMIKIIKDGVFWHALIQYKVMMKLLMDALCADVLIRITCYLHPLAIAANMVQEAWCHLDTVLLTFRFLTMQY